MRVKTPRPFRFLLLALFFLPVIVAGCSITDGVPQWRGSGFIKKELLEYQKVAVLPFKGDTKGEASDAFAKSFHEKFTQMEMVGRERLLEAFQEPDLTPDRIDEATRRKLGEVFGVQVLILGEVYYPSILRWLLQVQAVDVKTGEVMGRSLVEIDYLGAEAVSEGCKIAVDNLALK